MGTRGDVTTERDAYAVLQVSRYADRDVISAAYRAQARRYHPDGPTPDTCRMAELNRAYDQIKTPDARRRYDAAWAPGVPVGPGRPSYGGPPGTPGVGPIAKRRMARAAEEPGGMIDFGRYAGWRIADLAVVDPDYLRWLSRHSTGVRYREAIARHLPNDPDLGRRASLLR